MKVFPKLIDAITHSESESNLAIFSKEGTFWFAQENTFGKHIESYQ